MSTFTLYDLRCFEAVAREGGFQAAAAALNRSHPAVFAAVGRLEARLGLTLLERGGYRVAPTEAGRTFLERASSALREMDNLQRLAAQLASGEETVLRVVVGDLCPRPQVLGLLSGFFADRPRTRLHLDYEAVTGPWERLLGGEADLILHRIDGSDSRLESIDLCDVSFVPVVAPGFLPFPPSRDITPEQMAGFTQCIIRDSARQPAADSYFIVEGAPQCSAPDQLMKKELILHGMAWGHLPDVLIAPELRSGALVSIAGRHMPGRVETLAAARLRQQPHGPVAESLWRWLADHAAQLRDDVAGVSRP